MDDTMLASNTTILLAGLNNLLIETEPLHRWSRQSTLALREEILNMRHDTELIQLLLPEISVSGNANLTSATGAFGSVLQASIPAIRALTEGITGIVLRLRTENASLRPATIRQIKEKQGVIADTRDSLLHTFKTLWLVNWRKTIGVDGAPLMPASIPNEQLGLLLQAFAKVPFSAGATKDAFTSNTPPSKDGILQLDQWQYDIERISKRWLSFQAKTRELSDLVEAHRMFLRFVWVGCVESLRNFDLQVFNTGDFYVVKEIMESTITIRDGARDALLRSSSPIWSIVFVGAEDAGKSTFINAFIGMDVLPTTSGPTTAYPCRLRNSPGHDLPVLEFGTEYLNACLEEVRRGQWASKIDGLKAGVWDGATDLPDEYTPESLRSRWAEYLPRKLPEKLHNFMDDSFSFSSPVTGAENIKVALSNLNDFVRICQNLPVGFDRLEPVDWPLITMEFPRMKELSLPDGLMLVDIPGIKGAQDSVWDEATREIIRTAAMVVALVSLPSINNSPWRLLPSIVRQRTGVEVGAVLLTRVDEAIPEVLNTLEFDKGIVRSVFWPAFPKETDSSHPIITCSALVGPAVDILQDVLKLLGEKDSLPDWEFFTQEQYLPATLYIYGKQSKIARSRHRRDSVDDTKDRLQAGIDTFSFQRTFLSFLEVVNRVRQQSLFDYHAGLEVLGRGLSFNLRALMVLVGVAPGVGIEPGSDPDLVAIREQMELLDAWNVQVHAFQEEVHQIVSQTRVTLSNDMESCITKALVSATLNLETTHRSAPPLNIKNENPDFRRFDGIESIEQYMERYRTAFDDLARVLDVAAAESVLQHANKAHGDLFGELEDRLATPRLVSRADVNAILPRVSPSKSEDLFQHVEQVRSRYTVSGAFSQVQYRVLKMLNPTDDFQVRIRQLRTVSRFLLAIVSTIPFVLTLPYWLQKSYVKAYILRLQSLRPVLLREANADSSTFLDLLEGQITAETLRQTQVLINSKFPSAPHRGSVSADLDGIQHLVAASANVIGLSVAAEFMQKNLL